MYIMSLICTCILGEIHDAICRVVEGPGSQTWGPAQMHGRRNVVLGAPSADVVFCYTSSLTYVGRSFAENCTLIIFVLIIFHL